MGTPTFQFKQFTIAHDRCAMKVGTDGVLVGAWSELPCQGRILDVGTGTGLIALLWLMSDVLIVCREMTWLLVTDGVAFAASLLLVMPP